MPDSQKPSDHWVKDTLCEDVATQQRKQGVMPTPDETDSYMVGVLDKLQRKTSDRAPAAPDPVKMSSDTKFNDEYERRVKARGEKPIAGYDITKKLSPFEDTLTKSNVLKQRMLARMKLLQSKPEFRERMEALAFACAGKFGPKLQAEGTFKMQQIFEESNRLFGDWTKAEEVKIYSYVDQVIR